MGFISDLVLFKKLSIFYLEIFLSIFGSGSLGEGLCSHRHCLLQGANIRYEPIFMLDLYGLRVLQYLFYNKYILNTIILHHAKLKVSFLSTFRQIFW